MYASIYSTGLVLISKIESPNEVLEIEGFKALHNFGGSAMYALVKDSNKKKWQIAIDSALELKEIADYNKEHQGNFEIQGETKLGVAKYDLG